MSDRSGGVTTTVLPSVSSLGAPDALTYVFDRTGRIVLFELDRDGRVINGERGSGGS